MAESKKPLTRAGLIRAVLRSTLGSEQEIENLERLEASILDELSAMWQRDAQPDAMTRVALAKSDALGLDAYAGYILATDNASCGEWVRLFMTLQAHARYMVPPQELIAAQGDNPEIIRATFCAKTLLPHLFHNYAVVRVGSHSLLQWVDYIRAANTIKSRRRVSHLNISPSSLALVREWEATAKKASSSASLQGTEEETKVMDVDDVKSHKVQIVLLDQGAPPEEILSCYDSLTGLPDPAVNRFISVSLDDCQSVLSRGAGFTVPRNVKIIAAASSIQ